MPDVRHLKKRLETENQSIEVRQKQIEKMETKSPFKKRRGAGFR